MSDIDNLGKKRKIAIFGARFICRTCGSFFPLFRDMPQHDAAPIWKLRLLRASPGPHCATFWIHNGSFTSLSKGASSPNDDDDNDDDVVVVVNVSVVVMLIAMKIQY